MQLDAALYGILQVLHDQKPHALEAVAQKAKLSPDAVRRSLTELEQHAWVSVQREKNDSFILTKTGQQAIQEKGLPEMKLLELLHAQPLELQKIQSHFSNPQTFSVAFGLAKKSNWVSIQKKEDKTLLEITPLGKKAATNSPTFHVLQAIAREEEVEQNAPTVIELKARGLIESKTRTEELMTITPKGLEILKTAIPISQTKIAQLTPELIVSGKWKDAAFKPYDVHLPVEETFPGRLHPLTHTMRDIRRIMVEMGFYEMSSPLVESAFWNMDVMFIPQDHPAREIQDTFYLPGKAVLEDAELVKRVKATHEHGGKSGSKGHGYEWNPAVGMQLLLRTHGSATTYRTMSLPQKMPVKRFSIGRVFRNEAIDATHLAEFHQVDGYILAEGMSLRHLMGIVQEFYAKLGLKEIKFKPTYNPYTEPSMEAYAYNPKLKKWVELINSGVFRPETLKPLGINVPVISWGLGVERLAMLLHDKKTTKEVMGPEVDLDFIRTYNETTHTWEGNEKLSVLEKKLSGRDV
ncbi:MAG: phenylalanine--tRNA ligase subunit alpha [Candidatus Iainarchaeum archaeon]|uniref:phenylalanine--tRNA ligase n=1 Tax=Candidatus Iainarchaeum sp. TaxID=3101447 RepID=A0A7T9DJ60_9ARCH|nr:MAG: phenylalanine--tRNA ligase subunit alpha [Candidatus Diapherotrites archaeon]